MKKVKNVTSTARTVAGVTVDPGGTGEFPNELAERLLEQSDVWRTPRRNKKDD